MPLKEMCTKLCDMHLAAWEKFPPETIFPIPHILNTMIFLNAVHKPRQALPSIKIYLRSWLFNN